MREDVLSSLTTCHSKIQAFDGVGFKYIMSRSLCKFNTYKNEILTIYQRAVEAVRPGKLIEDDITIKDNLLRLNSTAINQFTRASNDPLLSGPIQIDLNKSIIHVIGGGKSVLPMACALARKAIASNTTEKFSSGKLILPVHLKVDQESSQLLKSIKIDCDHGARHNLPDDDSLAATLSLMSLIEETSKQDISIGLNPSYILLIAGGGSACLTAPKFVSLEEKLAILNHLVKNGADIIELNKVRRFFSNIKGGQLASHIFKSSQGRAQILSLILSDVIGDPIEYIASGPTYIDEKYSFESHYESMLDVMRKYKYPELQDVLLRCQLKEVDHIVPPRTSGQLTNHIIGSNKLAIDAAIHEAQKLGYRVLYLSNNFQGCTSSVATDIHERALAFIHECEDSEKILVIGGGEATVKLKSGETWGIGGRVQELTLDYLLLEPPRVEDKLTGTYHLVDLFFAGSTDGQDGPTDVAACMASKFELEYEKTEFLKKAMEAKSSHDSNRFWNQFKPNWLVKTGLTQTNVMDLYMLILSKERIESD